jgi:hypothetical protein
MMTSTFSPGRLTTSSVPLPTPFWFSGAVGSAPASCLASIINPNQSNTIYCCNGLLIDITQPILGSSSFQQQPFYFQDLRCCSGDQDVALGSVTSCSTGTAALLATSVAQVTSHSNSSTIHFGVGSTSTSTTTVLARTQITTTATAAAPSTSEGVGRAQKTGITIYLLTILSIILLTLVP